MSGLNAREVPSSGGGNRVVPDALKADLYPARVCQIIDLGLQTRKPYQGQPKDPMHHIRITYELSDEFMKDEDGNDKEDSPRWLSEKMPFYNIKAEKATSTLRMRAIDPEGITGDDFTQLIGMPCQLVVIKAPHPQQAGKEINYVNGVTGPVKVKGYVQPQLVNPTTVFLLNEPDMEVWETLPEFLQKMIKGNLEFNGSMLEGLSGAPDNVVETTPIPAPAGAAPTPPPPPAP